MSEWNPARTRPILQSGNSSSKPRAPRAASGPRSRGSTGDIKHDGYRLMVCRVDLDQAVSGRSSEALRWRALTAHFCISKDCHEQHV